MPTSTIRNWVQAFKTGKLGDLGKYQRPLTEIEMELSQVKRELVKVKKERDESFWGTFKQEFVHHQRHATREEAMRDIREYIEVFYNRQRKQARLGYLSPAAYEQKFYAEQQLSA